MYPSIKQKLMHEIDLLPETKLAEVYDFAHYLRLGVKKQNRKNKDLLSFAGSWNDTSDGATDNPILPEEMEHSHKDLKTEILEIGKYCSSLPVLDDRSPDDILGYDERGMPN